MKTKVKKIWEEDIKEGCFREAGRIFRRDGIVGIPTETVYGLAAWVGSEKAVARIYEAKGRPSDNPLIVHVWPGADLSGIVAEVPELARPLMEAFWPGPMTLVMKKDPSVTPKVTGGLDTVAVRMPSHPVTQALLSELRLPLVAPSANTSGRPSPTTAQHVLDDLGGKIPLIIDAGPCGVGVESTVIDVTGTVPVILRPGAVTREMIREVCGDVAIDPAVTEGGMKDPAAVPKAPGMKYRHYAPRGRITVLEGSTDFWEKALTERPEPEKSWVLILTEEKENELRAQCPGLLSGLRVYSLGPAAHMATAAERLFAVLREMDDEGIDYAFAEALPREGIGEAVMNRLLKAAGGDLRKESLL